MMNVKIRLCPADIVRMRREDVIFHYMRELKLSEWQAVALVSAIHPLSEPSPTAPPSL